MDDQRRWFVRSPEYRKGGAPAYDMTVVEAVTVRQAIVVGVRLMQRDPARFGWPAAAAAAGLDPVIDVTAEPVDEDDVATQIATGYPPAHTRNRPVRAGR